MKYAQHRSNRNAPTDKKGRKLPIMPIIIGGLLIVIIVLFVQLNRTINTLSEERTELEQEIDTQETTEEIIVTSEPDEVTVKDVEEASVVENGDARFEEIAVYHNGTQLVSGLARRQVKQDEFVHVIVVDLPDINPEIHYYEAWLVQPGITDYFSTGSLFQRVDGKFALVYKIPLVRAPKDIFTYSDLVITREIHDGNEWPSPAHMAEGEFAETDEEL